MLFPSQVPLFTVSPPLKVSMIRFTTEELKNHQCLSHISSEEISPALLLMSHWFISHPPTSSYFTPPASTLDSTTKAQLAWVLLNRSSARKSNIFFPPQHHRISEDCDLGDTDECHFQQVHSKEGHCYCYR